MNSWRAKSSPGNKNGFLECTSRFIAVEIVSWGRESIFEARIPFPVPWKEILLPGYDSPLLFIACFTLAGNKNFKNKEMNKGIRIICD